MDRKERLTTEEARLTLLLVGLAVVLALCC